MGSTGHAAAPPLLRVAHVRRVHGLAGEVRVQALGGQLDRFARGTKLIAERQALELTLRSARGLDGDELLLAFEELGDREQVAALSGDYLCVEPAAARSLRRGEWFVWQLVGLRAITVDGAALGVVADVEAHPASDVLVVRQGRAETRYPMVRAWVRQIDVAAGSIVLTPWPEDG